MTEHPTNGLDDVVHQRVRLGILAIAHQARRVEFGFLLAAGVLFALLYYVYRRPHERVEDIPTPGSPEELEVRLAAIDDNT